MTINELILKTAEKLWESFNNYKDAQEVFKNLKKDLKNELKADTAWQELEDQVKLLKHNRKEMSEQIKDLSKAQDQIAVWLEQYEQVQDYAVEMEDKFSNQKDKSLNSLSRELAEKWIIAEIEYKNWQLILIVAKHA